MMRSSFCRIFIPIFLLLVAASVRAETCIISGDLTRAAASERVNKVALTVFDAWISSCVDWNGSLDTYPCGLLLIFK